MDYIARLLFALTLLPVSYASDAVVGAPNTPVALPAVAGWLADGRGFWYRNPTGVENHVFHLIDLTTGTDTPICDHAVLAGALTVLSGKPHDAQALPLERLSMDLHERWLRFRCAGRRFHFYPQSKTLIPLPNDIDPDPRPAHYPSIAAAENEPSDPEVFVPIHNATQYDAIATWISDTGERRSYGALPPGETRRQHTYAGHQWEFATAGGFRLATITATPGMPPITLSESGDGAATPWRATRDETTLTLQHVSEPRQLRVDVSPDHPTGAIRSDPSGTLLAVAVQGDQAPRWSLRWRLFRVGASSVEPLVVGRP